MGLSYDYIKQKMQQDQTNVPPLLAFMMAMRMRSPIQHIQGYIKSLQTPPLGNNDLLWIAPAAARATGNKIMMYKCTYFADNSDGCGGCITQ